jgi:hypothetical protein
MNKFKILIAGMAALSAGTAYADTVIHITGSTAFRGATVTAIQNLMGGAGNFKAAFGSTSGGSNTASNRLVIQGNIPGLPAGANPVTVKCSWSGSTGGIKTLVQNIPVTTWPSITNLPATNTSVGIADASLSYALDTGTFNGESALADVTMEDSSQAATGFTTTTLAETRVGVIAFEWVAGNGAPANLNNITPLLAQAVLSGGAPLSQFTGSFADVNETVYVSGRDFDSGTRLSCLTESGLSPFSGIQHIEAVVSGTAGQAGSNISTIKLYHAETVLGQSFPIGQSGYASGGTLADILATPGAASANTTTGVPGAEQVLFGNGHLVGYLGRNDASRAVKTNVIAGNTAHRMKYNGLQIWNDPIGANGVPTSYNDNLITEGIYPLWEFENLAYKSTFTGNAKAIADAIAQQIINNDASVSGIKLNDMHCTKAVEGGVITSNQI